jgi:hypothetical protein
MDEERTRMRLEKWTPQRKNTLRGFVNIRLANGLRVFDCPVLMSDGRAWATLPAKPQLNRDGQQVKLDGKAQYVKILEWSDRATANRFSELVVALVREHDPAALSEEPADNQPE